MMYCNITHCLLIKARQDNIKLYMICLVMCIEVKLECNTRQMRQHMLPVFIIMKVCPAFMFTCSVALKGRPSSAHKVTVLQNALQ